MRSSSIKVSSDTQSPSVPPSACETREPSLTMPPVESQHLLEFKRLMSEHKNAFIELVPKFGYALLTPEGQGFLERIAPPSGYISVGSGVAFVESQLATRGIPVIASDLVVPQTTWTDVVSSDHSIAEKYPERALLLSYPEPNSSFATEAVKLYCGAGGKTIVFLGDARGLPFGSSPCLYGELDRLTAESHARILFDEAFPVTLCGFPGIRRRPTFVVTTRDPAVVEAAGSFKEGRQSL